MNQNPSPEELIINPENQQAAQVPTEAPVISPENSPEPIIEGQPSAVQFEQPPQTQPQPIASQPAQLPVQDPAQPVQNTMDNNQVDGPVSEKIDSPWIDKAEDILKRDKNNPYQEEEDHEDLQEEYLHKRFGKELKTDD